MAGKEYRTITDVKGPLVFLNKTEPVAYGEIVSLRLSNGDIKNGQVLDTSDDMVVVQVFEGTAKVDRQAGVTFLGDVFKLPVSTDLVGRILDGAGRPRDGGPEIVADEKADIIGAATTRTAVRARTTSSRRASRPSIAAPRLCAARSCRFSRHPVYLTTTSLCRLPDRQGSWAATMTSLWCSARWESPPRSTTSSCTT